MDDKVYIVFRYLSDGIMRSLCDNGFVPYPRHIKLDDRSREKIVYMLDRCHMPHYHVVDMKDGIAFCDFNTWMRDMEANSPELVVLAKNYYDFYRTRGTTSFTSSTVGAQGMYFIAKKLEENLGSPHSVAIDGDTIVIIGSKGGEEE